MCFSPIHIDGRSINQSDINNQDLAILVEKLIEKLRGGEYDLNTDSLYFEIERKLESVTDQDSLIAEAYYTLAAYNQNNPKKDLKKAIIQFEKSLAIWSGNGVVNENYAKACSNLGSLYLGSDPLLSLSYSEEGLKVRQELFGLRSEKTVPPIQNLSASYFNTKFFDSAIETALLGIEILNENNGSNTLNYIKLHYSVGSAYMMIGNYSNAHNYLSVAYNICIKEIIEDTETLLLLLNGLAVSYGFLGDNNQSVIHFDEALRIIKANNYSTRSLANTIVSNYAYQLVKSKNFDRAEELLLQSTRNSISLYGESSVSYLSELEKYAYFISKYRDQHKKALEYYSFFEEYISKNPENKEFANEVYYGYARVLANVGRRREAIQKLDLILGDSILLDDKSRINSLVLKREMLVDLYNVELDQNLLMEAFEVISSATQIYDRFRVDLNNEESQLKVAERFDYVYEDCIGTLDMLYQLTREEKYKKSLFSYSERSKASSLLSITRASRAIKFHIPENLAILESKFEKEINVLSELLINERKRSTPDQSHIANLEEMKLRARMKDDSLKNVFKRDYPRYNSLKSSTTAAGFEDVRSSIGRDINFIEYYVSDTTLYIYLVNRKYFELRIVPFTEELQSDIKNLRQILVNPAIESGARVQFNDYSRVGHSLYSTLIEPFKEFLISDKITIAPDNILYYIPFEAFLTESVSDTTMNYRSLPFMVDSYDITYAYSGTLLSETKKVSRKLRNSALVFAPEYRGDIYVDSIMVSRQLSGEMLDRIPGAREEAINVNRILGGDLFLDVDATESRFKERASEGDVIHLAMHTLLNDAEPMYSKMVFYLDDDGPNDGKLNTYEVYNIPLNAKMVVLSSCNTGSGYLQSGEGVMSLARGFFYSGSPAVVMSLWEVDDRSGSQIVGKFYSNLQKGYSKSKSLRRARITYLKEADQMRSHPYFWCTTVIMGDDSPIFYSRVRIGMIILLGIALILGIYFRQRIRSS